VRNLLEVTTKEGGVALEGQGASGIQGGWYPVPQSVLNCRTLKGILPHKLLFPQLLNRVFEHAQKEGGIYRPNIVRNDDTHLFMTPVKPIQIGISPSRFTSITTREDT
jgi:hypothetical protein